MLCSESVTTPFINLFDPCTLVDAPSSFARVTLHVDGKGTMLARVDREWISVDIGEDATWHVTAYTLVSLPNTVHNERALTFLGSCFSCCQIRNRDHERRANICFAHDDVCMSLGRPRRQLNHTSASSGRTRRSSFTAQQCLHHELLRCFELFSKVSFCFDRRVLF